MPIHQKYSFCYKNHADIDLNTLFISLKSFNEESHHDFFDAILTGDTSDFFININQDFDSFKKYAEIESLLLHEKTHYLDMTSTYYGLEYFNRKHNYYSVFNNLEDDNYERYKEAFAINLYELRPLDNLKEIIFNDWNDSSNYSFCLDDNEKFGVYLKFIIYSNTGEINIFPLSMLMILETRAFCIEYLSLFDKKKYLNGLNEIIYERSIQTKFEQELNDCSMSEYNFLLKLAILEFNRVNIDSKKTLEFVSYLLGWTLDLSFMMVASISSNVARFFRPSARRDALQMDMSRGMSRAIIPFVIIQSVQNYIVNRLPDFELLKPLIETSPQEAIEFILEKFLHVSDYKFEVDEIIDSKNSVVKNIEINNASSCTIEILNKGLNNSVFYKQNGFNVNFLDYYFMCDIRNVNDVQWGEWIRYKNLCEINFEQEYTASDTNYEQISMDVDLYQNFQREHMFIQLAVSSLDQLITNPNARHAYIFD